MRISSAVLLTLALTACGRRDAPVETVENSVAQPTSDDRIDCALSGATAFSRDCTVERTGTGENLILTVRHPDNGFHRLAVAKDGRGVVAADGAEAAKVTMLGDGRLEVAIGGDRYRLPATVKAKAVQ